MYVIPINFASRVSRVNSYYSNLVESDIQDPKALEAGLELAHETLLNLTSSHLTRISIAARAEREQLLADFAHLPTGREAWEKRRAWLVEARHLLVDLPR